MSYQLESDELTYCHGTWDPKTGTYRRSTPEEVISCCVDGCKGYVSYCFQQCHGRYGPGKTDSNYKNHKKCHSQCQQLLTNCKNVCFDYDKDATSLEAIGKRYVLDRADFSNEQSDETALYIVYVLFVILGILAIYILRK